MSTTTTQAQPDLNHAADALIQALEHIEDLRDFRARLAKAVFWSNCQMTTWPNPQVNDAWKAFAALADAVHDRREENAR
jgi:hypothetical protein